MITLTRKQIEKEALRLHLAEMNREQVSATTMAFPNMTVDDAYAIQSAWMDLKKSEGRHVVGHKIGLTSKVMQRAMNIDEPDYGTLLDDMVITDGSAIEAGAYLDPRVEVEVAFILKKELSGNAISMEDVLAATDHIRPALELIAARTYRIDPTTGYKRTVRDTISDNAANGGIILGKTSADPGKLDMRWISALLFRNEVIEESGVAAAILNHPANGVAWLSRKYAAHGIPLLPGHIILAGSFTSPIKVQAGDKIRAEFRELGEVSCHFL